ncbi:hypothetical protein LZG00_10930 [Rhodobacteraceae bacterium LMO-12]|nr:hypothetical protein [Rhodobacteraceae bacterium LMO-JJ12]
MADRVRHIGPRLAVGSLALTGLLTLGACDRHSEDEAHALMAGWFDLGETLYFESQSGCTAAIYRVKSGDVKSRVPLFDSVAAVVASDRLQKPFAISVRGKTADALFIDLMNADRPTGVAIQAAGINARDCMNERARNTFHAALNADPSIVVFSVSETAFAVLDPVRGVVMLTSGDV